MAESEPQHSRTAGAAAAARLADVRSRISAAARDADRDPGAITLVAVSKTFDAGSIRPVLAAGQGVFGENRVQEALGKWPSLKAHWPDTRLHLIGPLQTNKVRDAVALFDVIETVDRPRLADALVREQERIGRAIPCFIQVNTGAEAQKAGILPTDADTFIDQCRERLGLAVDGLMCIPPIDDEPSLHFALLAEIAKRHGLTRLSMGMSADFEIAIALGATHVRVGTAIFGTRAQRP